MKMVTEKIFQCLWLLVSLVYTRISGGFQGKHAYFATVILVEIYSNMDATCYENGSVFFCETTSRQYPLVKVAGCPEITHLWVLVVLKSL